MSNEVTRLFDEFDRGRLSRRQLFQALGLAAAGAGAAAMWPATSFAHGAGRARDTSGQRRCTACT